MLRQLWQYGHLSTKCMAPSPQDEWHGQHPGAYRIDDGGSVVSGKTVLVPATIRPTVMPRAPFCVPVSMAVAVTSLAERRRP